MKILQSLLLASTILLASLSCSNTTKDLLHENTADEIIDETIETTEAIQEPSKKVTFSFVGDLMTHPLLVSRVEAEQKVLMHVSNYYIGKDVSFANLEFTVNTNKPAQPYPSFNGTYDYLKYFSEFFDTFSIANNHAYDQGPQAQIETMGFLADFGDLALGGAANNTNIAPTITNINGIDIFLAAYTSLDNGLAQWNTTRGEYSYYMNFYPEPDYAAMLSKLSYDLEGVGGNTLKIVSLHYGVEYTTNARAMDIKLMRDMVEMGVDVVVAHHPHVIRPVEYYVGTNHSGMIIQSLGNFLANHSSPYKFLDIGASVFLTVHEDESGAKTYEYDYLATHIYFFDNGGVRDVRIIPIRRDPAIYGYPFATVYNYNQITLNKLKNGFDLVQRFFSPLTNVGLE